MDTNDESAHALLRLFRHVRGCVDVHVLGRSLCTGVHPRRCKSSRDDEDRAFLVQRADVRHCRDGTTEISATCR